MKILSLDLETSWTSPVNAKACRIFEIGAVLYDWKNKKPLRIMSDFIYEEDHPLSPPELVALTGITDEMRKEHGVSLRLGLTALNYLMRESDYVLAHNGNEFDKIVLQSEIDNHGFDFRMHVPWIDSKTDVPYPPNIKTSKLTYLCAEHGFVNPFSHRAVFDALSTIKLVEEYPIEEIIELSKQPTVKVIASVSYQNKDQARERGYYWDGENKYWWKSMKEKKAYIEQNEAPFSVQIRGL